MRHAVGERCIVANPGRAVSGSAVNQKGLIMIIMAVQPTPGVFAVSGVRFSTSSLPSDGKNVRQRIAFQAAPPLRHSSSDKQRSRRASGAALEVRLFSDSGPTVGGEAPTAAFIVPFEARLCPVDAGGRLLRAMGF